MLVLHPPAGRSRARISERFGSDAAPRDARELFALDLWPRTRSLPTRVLRPVRSG